MTYLNTKFIFWYKLKVSFIVCYKNYWMLEYPNKLWYSKVYTYRNQKKEHLNAVNSLNCLKISHILPYWVMWHLQLEFYRFKVYQLKCEQGFNQQKHFWLVLKFNLAYGPTEFWPKGLARCLRKPDTGSKLSPSFCIIKRF